MPTPLFESIRRTPAVNEGDSDSEWMSPAAYRPLVMAERKSLGTAERIRLTDQILLGALFTGLGANRKSSHVEQGNIAIHRYRQLGCNARFMLCVLALPADDARPRRRSAEEKNTRAPFGFSAV